MSALSPMNSPERARVLPLMTQASPSAGSVRGGTTGKLPSPLSSPTKSSTGNKGMPSPVHEWLAKRKSTIPYEPAQGVVYTDKVVVRDDNSFDEDDEDAHSNEGSDVFPMSPEQAKPPRTPTAATAAGAEDSLSFEDSAGVIAFSPGSLASPPPRNIGTGKLSISTTAEVATAGTKNIPQNIPSTPDSPWDEDSDEEEGEQGGGDQDQDDTSSVDSEVRSMARSIVSEGIASPTHSTTSAAVNTTTSSAAVGRIPGPSLSSISQKSPVKLSGSLLRSGRTSSLGFGSTSGYK